MHSVVCMRITIEPKESFGGKEAYCIQTTCRLLLSSVASHSFTFVISPHFIMLICCLHWKGCVISHRPQLICHVATDKSYVLVCDLFVCHSRSVLLPQRLCVCVCVCRLRTAISFLTRSFIINSQVLIKLPLCQQFKSWLVLQWVMCGLGEMLD